MAKYDCSSFDQYANLLKKDIKAAMRGKIRIPADVEECECGFVEVDASKEECEKIILDSVDEIVHRALRAQATSRALEKLAEENGVEHTEEALARYIVLAEEEELKFNGYEYEPHENESDIQNLQS